MTINIPELLKPHFERPVGILGNGVSGKAVANLLSYLNVDFVVYDRKKGNNICEDFSEERCQKHSLIVYSPGFSLNHPWLRYARKSSSLCLSELDFGGLFWCGKIIAVTGTNGKSTLTQFLADALNKINFRAIPCGNIGNPLTAQYNYFNDKAAIAVCEVSSFQAEGLCYFTPDALLWTNFDEDHLDRHRDLETYFEAKWTLVRQLRSNNLYIGESVDRFAKEHFYTFPFNPIVISDKDIESFKFFPKGLFNKRPQAENYLLAWAYWNVQGYDKDRLYEVGFSFQSLPHRMTLVTKIKGKTFWNDSKGTNFLATLAALREFGHRVFWIGGGIGKGGDLENFVSKISPYIQEAFLIGQTASNLVNALKTHNILASVYCSLEDAVQAAFERSLLGRCQDIVFSPGFASFDMFSNAQERGIFFENKVLELKRRQKTLEMAILSTSVSNKTK